MLSVAVCGSLMERSGRIAEGQGDAAARAKTVIARFYVEQIVPEALGLEAASSASAYVLYALDAATLAA